jgi:superfamily II DNA or RNA helicase
MNVELLLPPQREHAVSLLNSLYINGVACDQSETGTGKTYVAAWLAKNLNSPVVIVCTKVVIPSWTKVLSYFGIKAHCLINYEKLMRGNTEHLNFKDGKDNGPSDYVINFPKNSLVILDEVHKCKSATSKNSDFLIKLKMDGYKSLLLSATAATNPLEMKAFGFATTLHNLVSYRQFITSSGAYAGRYGGFQIDLQSQKTVEAMSNIHNTLFNLYKVSSRMTTKMFDTIFPDNRVIADCFDMGANTDKINRAYEQMESELAALEESSAGYSSHHFAVSTKYRRLTELLKVPTMVEMIEDLFDEGISPIVFVNYTDTVEAIKSKLEKNSKFNGLIGTIVGGQSDKARQKDVDDFQSDTKRVMIINIAAGGVGVSLHDLNGKFPRHTIISPTWSAINMLQALGRAHRANGKTPVIQKIMFAANTIETDICKRVKHKFQNMEALNDGDLDFSLSLTF